MKNTCLLNKKGQAVAEMAVLSTLIILGFSVVVMYGQRLGAQNQLMMEAFRKAIHEAYNRNTSVTYSVHKDARMVNLFAGFGRGASSGVAASASVMWQKGLPGNPDYIGTTDEEGVPYNESDIKNGHNVSVSLYEINGDKLELPTVAKDVYGDDGSLKHHGAKIPAQVWKEESKRVESYSSSVAHNEQGGRIINTKSADLKDRGSTTLYTRADLSVNSSPWDPQVPFPAWQDQGILHPAGVSSGPTGTYDAYYNTTDNRIEYRKAQGTGTVIHRERSWETNDQ